MQWIAARNGIRAHRSLTRVIGLLVLAALLPLTALAAKVSYLEIPAQVKRKGATEWKVLAVGDEVKEGDTIRTGTGGRVEVMLGPKRVFRIGQATEVELPSFDEAAGLKANFNVFAGRFWASIRVPLVEALGEKVEVQTQTATIGIKGTQFGVDHDKKSEVTGVTVVEGKVEAAVPKPTGGKEEVAGPREVAPPQEVTRDRWFTIVTRNQKLVIRPGIEPSVQPMTAADKADEWVVFNQERDKANDAGK
jgi:hypothetical protein